MSADSCGCDPEASHMCDRHRIDHLEDTIVFLKNIITDLNDERLRLREELSKHEGDKKC